MAEGIKLVSARDDSIADVNPRYEAMLGYQPGELLGRPVSIVNAPGEPNPADVAAAIMGELRRVGHWHGEVRNQRKDGRQIWVRTTVSRFDHSEFGPVFLSINSDITEVKLAQLARDEATAQLARLAANIQESIEAERTELSRELHDQLGSALTGLRMGPQAMATRQGRLFRAFQQSDTPPRDGMGVRGWGSH
jgi:PAS domain S-box-containing protein